MSLTFVIGGMRSGKSRYAEYLATQLASSRSKPVVYVAPGRPADSSDPEWSARIARHQARRPDGWRTVETRDVGAVLAGAPGVVLLDCLGTWLTGIVDDAGSWDDLDAAETLVSQRVTDLTRELADSRGSRDIVVVSNEVGMSLVPLDPAGRFFVDELGRLNTLIADLADTVSWVVAGRVLDLTTAPRVPWPGS